MPAHKEKAPQKRGFREGADFRSQRESSETPMLNAFCRVAPRLRLSVLAIFGAGVFDLAIVFSSRISSLVHSRRFDAFLAITPPSAKVGFQTANSHAPARVSMSTGLKAHPCVVAGGGRCQRRLFQNGTSQYWGNGG